jgi:hypothetical protein
VIGDGSAVFSAAGRDWSFKLTIGQWIKLQKHFGGGPQKISARFSSDDWIVEDVREMIERGLEGAGMDANEARENATTIFNGQALDPNYKLAIDIMGSAWAGMDEYAKKKAVVEAATAALSKIATGNGTSSSLSASASSPGSSHPKQSGSALANISQ